ncbi:MAG TPA: SCO1664 family protein [Anaerolineales bacterium]|jgi:uncharacterized repeat protein (TIGR03843 family)|nr:SCO1664 family protein [Anaerolineales bacterium]
MSTAPDRDILTALQQGEVTVKGEFLWGSNYTFSVQVSHEDSTYRAVYKPTRGERPLWDFPRASLARREVAAYLVSEATGWRFVPPTVYRGKGPIGAGSLQLYVEHDPEYNYFNLRDSDRQRLRPVALFDLMINNADRKGSHILFDGDHKIWLIDHGICFHRDAKLRTVIWDFAGEPIPGELCADMTGFLQRVSPKSELAKDLKQFISREEVSALFSRTERLLKFGRFPNPHPNRRPYPWPPV